MARKRILTKEKRIEEEIKRLEGICKDIEEHKRATAQGLLEECAFMRITLQDLRNEIDTNGVVDEMQQGSYSIIRESPYIKTYHTMIQRYTTASEKLLSLLPKEECTIVDSDEFDDFVSEREDI